MLSLLQPQMKLITIFYTETILKSSNALITLILSKLLKSLVHIPLDIPTAASTRLISNMDDQFIF